MIGENVLGRRFYVGKGGGIVDGSFIILFVN